VGESEGYEGSDGMGKCWPDEEAVDRNFAQGSFQRDRAEISFPPYQSRCNDSYNRVSVTKHRFQQTVANWDIASKGFIVDDV